MNDQNQNTTAFVAVNDQLARDFVMSALIVSVLTNLVVFVSWLAITLAV